MIEWTLTKIGSCRKLIDVPDGAVIEFVNGRTCLGVCDGCSKPVLEGQNIAYDKDGAAYHAKCCVPTDVRQGA